jgi:glutamate---cysteine ligase / carboxylate-amine ligase
MLPPLRDALLNAARALLNDVHFLAQRISLKEPAFCADSGVTSKKQLRNRKLCKAARRRANKISDMKSTLGVISPNGACFAKKPRMRNAPSQRIVRKKNHIFTLGIEEELQIIDPETRELRSYIQQILADGKMILKEQIKPELHQSIVEIGTEICTDARHARRQIIALRTELAKLAGQHRLVIASAGTHPFSHWMDQLITVNERYTTLINDMQQVARVCLTFGLHVHVGIPDREEAIDIMNQARYFLPHLYALSANSPFWLGQNTGLKAYRQMIFERLPRTGIPDAFQSLSEYEDYLKLLVATKCIDNPKKIWWDVRLHPFFDTIEFRICDAQSRVDDTIALAALMQAIVFKLQKLRRNNVTFRSYSKRLIDENRWRAGRYGLDGKLIDFGRKCEVDERDLLEEMLEFVSAEVVELGNQRELEHIERIMREGTGADRQLMVWERTQDMKAVVDQIVAETNEGLTL